MKLPKFFLKIVGAILILSYFIPIPLGTLRLALGMSILICASLSFALFLQRMRVRFAKFNGLLVWVENKMGERLTGPMRLTRPGNDPRVHFKR